jgi:hypothetical protein
MADETAKTEKAADKAVGPVEEKPYGKGSLSATEPVVAPDGHVSLSQEDIDERDADA